MKKIFSFMMGLAVCLSAQAGRINTDTITSKVLGDKVVYNIYLPNGYEHSTKLYPVVYLLHGLTDDYRAWRDRGQMQIVVDELIGSGECVPVVIIMPNATR